MQHHLYLRARPEEIPANLPRPCSAGDWFVSSLEKIVSQATFDSMAANTLIQAELPPELTERARSFVEEGWAGGMNELLAEALRRFLESHGGELTASMVKDDVNWGLHGKT